ncbi:MAG: MCE family protein [Phycisphaeraceae bacterium]|nr:MCE family protein [Phycisphaeraceae bacterium]
MSDAAPVPSSEVVRVRRVTWALLAPLAAAAVLSVLAVQAIRDRPVPITIRFADGAGVRPGDPVTCRGVQVGVVREVGLSGDLAGVVIEVALARESASLALEGTRFWIVRPEVSLRGVSGLESLLGPRSIAASPGVPGSQRMSEFEGLPRPPDDAATPIEGELIVVLRAARRGSVGIGSPVYYRDVHVGEVRSVRLADDARTVELTAAVEPRYAPLVLDNTRFFNVSGIGVNWGLFGGLSVRTDSLESLIAGGIAFATPDRLGAPVTNGHVFDLAPQPDSKWLEWSPAIPLNEAPP